MKKIIYILIFSLIISVFVGCTKSGGIYSNHFLDGYLIPTQINTGKYGGDIVINNNVNGIHIWFYELYVENPLSANRWADFETYSQRWGDIHFNRRKPMPYDAIAEPLTSISVVSDRDYDELHPAGTPLDDVAKLLAVSPYQFIKNGYQYSEQNAYPIDGIYEETDPRGMRLYGFDLIYNYLNELTQDEMTLVDPEQFYIIFPKNCPTGEIHTLTITIVYQGNELVTSVKYKF